MGILCGVSGCSSDEDDDGSPEPPESVDHVALSGTRLSAEWDTPEDGEARFLGFYDSKKKVHCTFMLAEDGEQRCLPKQEDAVVYYEDEDCEVPSLWWESRTACEPSEATVPRYASTLSNPSCPAAYSVYEVGEYLDDGSGMEQRQITASGLCVGGISDASYMKRYSLDEEDNIQSWVKGEAETITVKGSRIEVHYLMGEDGSSVRLGQYDTELATPCIPVPMGEAGTRCVPETGSYLSDAFSADDACDTLAATTETRCDTQSPFVVDSVEDDNACPVRSYFERKDKLSALYSASDCEPVDLELMSAVFHAVGEPIDADEFVELSPQRPSSKRLVRERFKDEKNQTIESKSQTTWYDNELNLLCSKQRTSDGEDRCVPGNFSEVIYKDASCTKPVTRVNPCDSSKHITALDYEQLDSCTPVQKVYSIGKAIDPSAELFVRIGEDCTPFNVKIEGAEYRNVTEIAPATFAAFEN